MKSERTSTSLYFKAPKEVAKLKRNFAKGINLENFTSLKLISSTGSAEKTPTTF
jgi:hypothetical protein